MKPSANYDTSGAASRGEHAHTPDSPPEDIHEIDGADLEELPPWEDPVQHLEATARRHAAEEQKWKHNEQRRASQEIARLTRREGLAHEARMGEMKHQQIVDLRRRETRLQEQLGALKWWQFGEKSRLNNALQLTVERLNGLSETTPDQRQRQRVASVKKAVQREIIQPIATRERNIRDRIIIQEPSTTQEPLAATQQSTNKERMHAASRKRDSVWTRFAAVFRPSIRDKARGEVFAATHAYATEHRVDDATTEAQERPSQERKKAA